MGECYIRRRATRQDERFHDGAEIAVILAETEDVTARPFIQQALGTTLPAPVETHHMETAARKVAHGFIVALEELGAAIDDDDSATRFSSR